MNLDYFRRQCAMGSQRENDEKSFYKSTMTTLYTGISSSVNYDPCPLSYLILTVVAAASHPQDFIKDIQYSGYNSDPGEDMTLKKKPATTRSKIDTGMSAASSPPKRKPVCMKASCVEQVQLLCHDTE
jgi:hypothetical protein